MFKRWGVNAEIQIHPFTFIDNTTKAYEALVNCDMFYFAGIYCSKLPAPLTNVSLVEILRGRVQCNEICYLGVCGGAMISGLSAKYGTDGLDLLDGVEVLYEACGKAKAAKVKTTTSTVHMTAGCAVFILMTPTERRGKSITVVRRHRRWQTFASENSIELQRFVDAKAKTWKKLR